MSTTDFLLQKHVLAAAAWVLIVAIAGGLATEVGTWYKALLQPPWKPPDWAFGVVWTCIFIASAFAWLEFWSRNPSANQKSMVSVLFLLNGAFNILWSVLYFKLHRPDWSMIEAVFLWASVAALIVVMIPVSSLAAWLMAPYLVWVSIAMALNWETIRLNGPFA
jgi:tryptophan-rich sensory protein